MKTRTNTLSTILLGAVGLAACDPLADDDYDGEPLATIQGVVVNESNTAPPDSEIVLFWVKSPAGGNRSAEVKTVAERVPVTGGFPASFKLTLNHPPPKESGIEHAGSRVHWGALMALKKGAVKAGQALDDASFEAALGGGKLLGVSKHSVVYVEKALAPDDPLAVITGGITAPGFHLLEPRPATPDQVRKEHEACVKLASGNAEGCASVDRADPQIPAPLPGGLKNEVQVVLVGPFVPKGADGN